MREFKGAAYTLMGRRTRNQDNFLLNGKMMDSKHTNGCETVSGILEGAVFCAVVDGCGTKTTGETAAELVCRHLWEARDKFDEVNDLSEVSAVINGAFEKSNEDIESVMEDEPTSKMGAAAAVLLIYNGKAIYGNVGDCAVYLRRDGNIQKLTCDHTEGEELIARGALTREMLHNHSSRNKVTRRIGYMSFGQTDIMQFYDVMDVKTGDVFVLASAGVVQFMTAEDINKNLQTCVDMAKSVERVAKAALNDCESKDNITALAIKISDQVDNVGDKNVKVKPIRANNVRVHTSLNIDKETVIKILSVAGIFLILVFAGLYAYLNYPKSEILEPITISGYTWTSTPGHDGVPTKDTEADNKKDNDDKSSDNDGDEDKHESDKAATSDSGAVNKDNQGDNLTESDSDKEGKPNGGLSGGAQLNDDDDEEDDEEKTADNNGD